MGLVSLPFTGLLSVFFKFIEVAQELIILLYLNANLPLNLGNMLEYLKDYELSFLLPFIFKHENENQVKSEKFGQNDLSSLFLDNAFALILISFVMPWFFLSLCLGIKKLFHLDKFKKIAKFIQSTEDFFKYNVIFLLFQNSTQEMSLFFALQLRYFSFSTNIQILSMVLCLLFLILNFYMIFWLIRITKLIILDKCYSIPKEYGSIFENLDINKKYALYYPIVKATKKIFLSFFVVFLYSHPATLLLCLIFLSICMYLFMRIVEPFETKYRNMICEITEFLECCIYGLLFLYNTCRLESTDDTALYIGYVTILLVIIIIILNFGKLLLNLLFGFAQFICKFNKLRQAVQLGDSISQKIESIKMREFTYEKIWKDTKTGLWFKQAMYNHRLVTFTDRGTQYESNFKPKEEKKKTITPDKKKTENIFKSEEIDTSKRKLKENECEMVVIDEQEIEEKSDFYNSPLKHEKISNKDHSIIGEKEKILKNN